jgi:hypothetical protein
MVDLFFQGMQGRVVLRRNAKTTIYVSPVAFLKLFLDYMLKIREQALKAKAAKQNSKGSGGGIRIVLQNPIVDPLLRPGQKPRPLRLLGQDPDKPLPDTTGTTTKAPATEAPASSGPVPARSPAPNSDDKFDPAELIEDFEDPVCEFCMGIGHGRDENGIRMVRCEACEGAGRAPKQESQ